MLLLGGLAVWEFSPFNHVFSSLRASLKPVSPRPNGAKAEVNARPQRSRGQGHGYPSFIKMSDMGRRWSIMVLVRNLRIVKKTKICWDICDTRLWRKTFDETQIQIQTQIEIRIKIQTPIQMQTQTQIQTCKYNTGSEFLEAGEGS